MTELKSSALKTAPAAAAATSPALLGRALDGGKQALLPLLLGAAAVLLWQGAVSLFSVPPFVLPGPFAITAGFVENRANIASASLVTGTNALVGLVAGGLIGVLAAVVAAFLPSFDRLAGPTVAALSVVPIVAAAPVLYTMFGAGEEAPRQIVAGIAVFVPVYVNSLRGFRQVLPVHRDLMRSYAAGRWQVTRAVTLPSAVPYMFTGLRIASSLAVISALIAEYFGGPVGGLGKSITSAAAGSNYTLAWAYVLGAVVVGLLFFCATAALEKYSSRH
ncbi:NitT/TauT family transport system permease protein [Arthrobacter sp. UYP6]|uniref:ABC transporter permease n=1 Tax=Arthrobacter sp. UYP6 TaxID=1756378 RepID=UPI00339A23FF